MNKRKPLLKKYLCIIFTTFLVLSLYTPSTLANNDDPYSYIVIDSITGDILLEKNPHELIYPASTTKILTAITALKNSGLTSIMTTSAIASGPLESGAVRLGLEEEEQMQLYELLHALLLKSANDVAIMIAENISTSVEDFAILCNEFAYSLGATNTNFTNPHGLHNDTHQTTAYDLALITSYALKDYTFSSIVSKSEYTLKATNMHDSFPRLVNSNPILGKNDGYNFIITGVKTGYTSKAKYVLVSSARNYDGREVICVVTGCPTRLVTGKHSLELINNAFSNYMYQSVIESGDIVTNIYIDDVEIPLASSKQIDYLLPINYNDWKIEKEINIYNDDNLTINRGDIKGEVIYKYNSKIIDQSYLVATREFIKYNIPNDTTITITNEDDLKKSNHYIWFIISFLWVIMLILIYVILSKYIKVKQRRIKDV